ncbi:GNAT family N-acetyltransferase [Anaerobacillus sp. CMMVII]|uniref:GNAT family N-acetyltransferase n=1 Tax=Anaerobacillus sp. CMMVII TaxID=2755588 RepID=UPI0021B7EB41|nr:GNAT family protein [Anaerobacillus sp. CMMVII]MCT8138237.1 GNAT family N-acetyltransferase [Anaerobacillus sp. CMMVII]
MEKGLAVIPKLETDHYLLRGMTLEDTPTMFVFMSDLNTMKYITSNPVRTVAELASNIEQSLKNFKETKEIPWVIVDKANGETIGMFRFHKLNLWHKKAEMGVVIREDYQKKGVMSELLSTILPFGFHNLGLNRIVGDIFAENQGSEKLLHKFGFQKEGQFRQTDFDGSRFHDTVVFSLLKDEFIKIERS